MHLSNSSCCGKEAYCTAIGIYKSQFGKGVVTNIERTDVARGCHPEGEARGLQCLHIGCQPHHLVGEHSGTAVT